MRIPTDDLYTVLGVPASADKATIRNAYRRRIRQLHPDLLPEHQRVLAHEQAAKVTTAWEFLADPVKRREYDAARGRAASPWPSPPPPCARPAPPPPQPPAPSPPRSQTSRPTVSAPQRPQWGKRAKVVMAAALVLALVVPVVSRLRIHHQTPPISKASGEYCSVSGDKGQMLSFYLAKPGTTQAASDTPTWVIMVPHSGDPFIAWWTPQFPYWSRANQRDGFVMNEQTYGQFQYVEVSAVWENGWEPLTMVFADYPNLTGGPQAEAAGRQRYVSQWNAQRNSPKCSHPA